MSTIDLKTYLFHGIIDWANYDNDKTRDFFCLEKLESILKFGFIYRPCDFKKYGINHNDTANPYTHYSTFVACHPDSTYSAKYKKAMQDDNGYVVATSYANFGILLDSKLLNELSIVDDAFCDKEIMIDDNISMDKYAIGIYINPIAISNHLYEGILDLISKNNYNFIIVNILNGSIITTVTSEKSKTKILKPNIQNQ